jgi:glycosyltransferase involved in cell wall biosynthesis
MLSVILTLFNNYRYIKRILNQILDQTYKDIELIIVDDSEKYCEEDLKKDVKSEFKYIKNKKNIGYLKSSIKGLSQAERKYIIFISDDDELIDKDFFKNAINFIETHDVDSVFGRIEIESNEKIVRNNYPFKTIYLTNDFIDEIIKLRFTFLDYFSFSSFVFKTEIFKQIKPFDSIYSRAGSVDISNIIKYLLITKKVGFIDSFVYRWYKSREGSLSGELKDDLVYQTLQSVSAGIDIYNFFEDKSICKYVCNEYIKYIFNAILSDYEQLNNEQNFNQLLNNLNDKMIKDVYIYCRGWVGLELRDYLEKNNINVISFIDDYKINFDDTISFNDFLKIKGIKHVIIASYKYNDIYRIFRKLLRLSDIKIFDLLDNS